MRHDRSLLWDWMWIKYIIEIFNIKNVPRGTMLILILINYSCNTIEVESRKPNIIWIVAEDLSPVIPSFGDSTIQTPHLSRLAREGVCYDRVFSPSGVCSPSRAAIATGMYPSHIGAHHMRTGGNPAYYPKGLIPYEAVPPAEVKMHREHLRRAGYYCTNRAKEYYSYIYPEVLGM